MRRCTGKPKPPTVRVLGFLHVMPRWPLTLHPGMLVAWPGHPSHMALSVDGGLCTMAPVLFMEADG